MLPRDGGNDNEKLWNRYYHGNYVLYYADENPLRNVRCAMEIVGLICAVTALILVKHYNPDD